MILNLAVEWRLELDRFTCFYDDAEEKWGLYAGDGDTDRPMHPIEKAGWAVDSVRAGFGRVSWSPVS